jgi:hypothetical protein
VLIFLGKRRNTNKGFDYTGKLMNYWVICSIVFMQAYVPVFMMVHYYIFPLAPIYFGSILEERMSSYQFQLALVFFGCCWGYFVHILTNCLLVYIDLVYFILSKVTN